MSRVSLSGVLDEYRDQGHAVLLVQVQVVERLDRHALHPLGADCATRGVDQERLPLEAERLPLGVADRRHEFR